MKNKENKKQPIVKHIQVNYTEKKLSILYSKQNKKIVKKTSTKIILLFVYKKKNKGKIRGMKGEKKPKSIYFQNTILYVKTLSGF